MHSWLNGFTGGLAAVAPDAWWYNALMFLKVLIGFSVIIFVHELGHFLAAKWVGIRVDRFAVGFGYRLFGWRRGEGLTFGNRPNYKADELKDKDYGETDYCFKALPIGGYVKMLGQDDIIIDEKTGDVQMSDDPRAFTNRPVGQRMIVASAGVVFNLLFAAVLLMCVFLLGRSMEAPEVGEVLPDSPAAGKLLIGDKIISINGRKVDSWKEITIATILADGPLRLQVERNGKLLEQEIVVAPEMDERQQLRTLGVLPLFTTVLNRDGQPVDDLPNVQKGDKITHVDGRPVRTALDILAAFADSRGRVLELTVERSPASGEPGAAPRVVRCYQRAQLGVEPADPPYERAQPSIDDSHILGMQRRRVVGMVQPGSPAEEAGFQTGDVIVEWGTVAQPRYQEILDSIAAHAGKQIRVLVERDGELKELFVVPKRKFKLFGEAPPRVGVVFPNVAEQRKPVVADVVPGTPAAALHMPRGSLILAIDGQPVADWFEVVAALRAAAGRTASVRYRTGDDEVTGTLAVPSSIVNELDLPPTARIWEIDGQRDVSVTDSTGETHELSLPGTWAVKKLLEQKIGQTVTVRFSRTFRSKPETATFTVRPDNVDPWQMRLLCVYDSTGFEVKTTQVRTNNPITALRMGVKVASLQVLEVYQFIKGLAKRNVGVQHVAGPVGIVGFAIQRAKMGFSELLFFLGFLSVNLAVLNFLPLPVLDGGLMVFLLIEKVKGKPLSLKTQMISTIVGLTAIILVGLFVTFQDISRYIG